MKFRISRFDAVIFDLDGTLVLSEHVWQAAKKHVASGYGVRVSNDVLDQHVGRRLVDFVVEELGDVAPSRADQKIAIDAIMAQALGVLGREIQVVEGAVELVRGLYSQGRMLAICSSAPVAAIDIALGVMGVADCFSHIVSAANMDCGKPDPAPYLRTLDVLGVNGDRAMAVEDSIVGLTSCKSAGLYSVLVGTDAQALDSGLADIQVDTMSGLLACL